MRRRRAHTHCLLLLNLKKNNYLPGEADDMVPRCFLRVEGSVDRVGINGDDLHRADQKLQVTV